MQKHAVRYFMVVPNAKNHAGDRLHTNDGQDFGGLFARYGYRLIAQEPKYRDPIVQQYGINPTYHFLFELQ